MKITLLYSPDDINMMYTLYPLLRSRHARLFDFTCDPRQALAFGNRALVVFKFWKYGHSAGGRSYLERARQQHHRLVYFDDLADPRQVMSEDMDLFDLYYKKSLLKDRESYRKEFYGHRLYSDYYHRNYGVEDTRPQMAHPLSLEQVQKLRLAWNIGVGSYPKTRIRKAIAMRLGARGWVRAMAPFLSDPLSYRAEARKIGKIAAHFRMIDERSVTYQRELFLNVVRARPDIFLLGRVSLRQYNREARVAAATLSPFGWGEVCFRDFEAIINRSVLLKPAMDHVETFPDVYRAGETYLSIDWDAHNLLTIAEECVRDPSRRCRVADGAYAAYRDGLTAMERRVEQFAETVLG